jgi:hypothetical protein
MADNVPTITDDIAWIVLWANPLYQRYSIQHYTDGIDISVIGWSSVIFLLITHKAHNWKLEAQLKTENRIWTDCFGRGIDLTNTVISVA